MNTRTALPANLRMDMMGAVLQFMLGSGMTSKAVKECFDLCISRLDSVSRGLPVMRSTLAVGNENVTAELLRIWHRDERYIDSDARPRPMPLGRGRNNLRATIRRINDAVDPDQILTEMRAVKLIKKLPDGRFLPTSESAIVGKLHPLAIDHIAKIVIRLVGTVSRNIDPSSKSLRLIERHAYAPDLNKSERKAFAQFSRTQGMSCLESIDNWLETRRVRNERKAGVPQAKGIPASVHIFAYLGDERGGRTNSAGSLIGPKSRGIAPRARKPTTPAKRA